MRLAGWLAGMPAIDVAEPNHVPGAHNRLHRRSVSRRPDYDYDYDYNDYYQGTCATIW
jgi:hypothetical protein